MANTKRSKNSVAAKVASKRSRADNRREHLEAHTERNGAHAYSERAPIIEELIRDHGSPMSVKEIYSEVRTGPTGLFATIRRVAATVRWMKRTSADADKKPIFALVDGAVKLSKRSRRTASKTRVSRKRTRSAK